MNALAETTQQSDHTTIADGTSIKQPPNLTWGKPGGAKIAAKPAVNEDVLHDQIHKIENLDKATALQRALDLEDASAANYFELGGVLSRIHRSSWFDPPMTFDKWVETETAMRRSKARVLVQVYDAVVAAGVNGSQLKKVGWTKMRVIARVLTKENAGHWIEHASQRSRGQLEIDVRKHVADNGTANPDASQPTHTKVFKLHKEQADVVETALEKAMKESGTQTPSKALEYVCLDFVGGVGLVGLLKLVGYKKARLTLKEAFPDFDAKASVSVDDLDA